MRRRDQSEVITINEEWGHVRGQVAEKWSHVRRGSLVGTDLFLHSERIETVSNPPYSRRVRSDTASEMIVLSEDQFRLPGNHLDVLGALWDSEDQFIAD